MWQRAPPAAPPRALWQVREIERHVGIPARLAALSQSLQPPGSQSMTLGGASTGGGGGSRAQSIASGPGSGTGSARSSTRALVPSAGAPRGVQAGGAGSLLPPGRFAPERAGSGLGSLPTSATTDLQFRGTLGAPPGQGQGQQPPARMPNAAAVALAFAQPCVAASHLGLPGHSRGGHEGGPDTEAPGAAAEASMDTDGPLTLSTNASAMALVMEATAAAEAAGASAAPAPALESEALLLRAYGRLLRDPVEAASACILVLDIAVDGWQVRAAGAGRLPLVMPFLLGPRAVFL